MTRMGVCVYPPGVSILDQDGSEQLICDIFNVGHRLDPPEPSNKGFLLPTELAILELHSH